MDEEAAETALRDMELVPTKGRLKKWLRNLSCYRRAVVLRWSGGSLWARAYDCGKHYSDGYSLTGIPNMKLVGVYRFRPGLAEETSRSWYGNDGFRYYAAQNGPLTGGRWNIHSPFSCNAEYGMGFDVIGLEEIGKSPFRYCMAAEYEKHSSYFLEFLTACCFYPRQIEMLMKAGMRDVVRDLAAWGVKNAMAINWTREDPMEAFGLDKQELRAFLATSPDIDILTLYKRLKGRVSMEETADWVGRDPYAGDVPSGKGVEPAAGAADPVSGQGDRRIPGQRPSPLEGLSDSGPGTGLSAAPGECAAPKGAGRRP